MLTDEQQKETTNKAKDIAVRAIDICSKMCDEINGSDGIPNKNALTMVCSKLLECSVEHSSDDAKEFVATKELANDIVQCALLVSKFSKKDTTK